MDRIHFPTGTSPSRGLRHWLEKRQEEFPLYHSHGQGNLKDDLDTSASSTPHVHRDEQKQMQSTQPSVHNSTAL